MENTKRSITIKVITGYFIIAALVGVAVWIIYTRVIIFSNMAKNNNNNNAQLFLVSDITSDLYETENVSRKLIQTGTPEDFESYYDQLDTIRKNLAVLDKKYYENDTVHKELDSIYKLLDLKTENLKALVDLREKDRNTDIYQQVMRQLKRVNETFITNNSYEGRFTDLKPHQRRVLIKWLEYAKADNAKSLTNQTADSLVNSVKKVLHELQYANKKFRNNVLEKENALLNNDMVLNQQLRKILANIEAEERKAAFIRTNKAQNTLEDTVFIMLISGVICVVFILLFLILIIKDVRRSQQYRIELEKAKNFAETLLKRREQFMATITHDLRSPLNTVIGYSDLLKKTKLATKQQHYLEHITKSSDFILRLVNDLLDLSKLEAGKMVIEELPFTPKELITDTVYNNIPATTNRKLEIRIDASPETENQFLSDPFRIKQIIANLITNAYKFTEKGSIIVSISVLHQNENIYQLLIKVTDTGIGISKEKQEIIFEEFSQEDNSIEKKYGGSGLGLTITRSLTSLLNGHISLKSEQGKGSEFSVSIPVKKLASKSIEATTEKSREVTNLDLSNIHVLVIDDEPSQLSLTLEFLKSKNILFETAENGKEGLEKLSKGNFDLVLTDIQMPVMDGFQFINAVRKIPSLQKIPIIALSGRTDMEETTYIQTGFSAKLTKPFKPTNLLNKICDVLAIKQPDTVKNNENSEIKIHKSNSLYNLDDIYLFSGEDTEAMFSILASFIESTKENIKKLEAFWEAGDHKDLSQIAHKMLPMLKQMQANALIQPLEKLEHNNSISQSEFEKLTADFKQLLELLNQEIKA
ncbi:ATP-binding protein [Zunongwangia sp.]|uniref:ATP-binding protein n=1 Tax=Zunongwangia sp. TaxID=1965325 RepID=UPI003AA8AFE5